MPKAEVRRPSREGFRPAMSQMQRGAALRQGGHEEVSIQTFGAEPSQHTGGRRGVATPRVATDDTLPRATRTTWSAPLAC